MSAPDMKLLGRLESAINHPAFVTFIEQAGSISEIGHAFLTFRIPGRDVLERLVSKVRKQCPDWSGEDAADWWEHHFADRADNPQTVLNLAGKLGWSDDPLDVDKQQPVAKPAGELQTSGRGAAISNTSNAVILLQTQQKVSFYYDKFLDTTMVHWPEEMAARRLGDYDAIRAQIEIQRFGLASMSRESTRDAIAIVARMDVRDCIADWLNGLTWDGVPRLTRMLMHSLGVEQNRLHAHAGRNLMIAAVARGLSPGCKVDEMLVLEGEQGARKTQWWEILGGPYYAELTADLRSKDFEQQLRGAWFAQHSELSALGRADIERVKQVTTCRIDKYRPSYGREVREYPRRCVFGGTTNNSEWLHDPTGGRRFIPIEVVKIDLDWLRENRDQLFAEAVVFFKRGYKWWYYPKLATLAAQQERMPDDPWLDPIREYLYGRHFIVNIGEVLQHALDMPADRQKKSDSTRVGIALKSLGCVRQPQRRIDGERTRPWSVPEHYAGKPCRRNGPVPAGAAAFAPLPTVTAPSAACDLN